MRRLQSEQGVVDAGVERRGTGISSGSEGGNGRPAARSVASTRSMISAGMENRLRFARRRGSGTKAASGAWISGSGRCLLDRCLGLAGVDRHIDSSARQRPNIAIRASIPSATTGMGDPLATSSVAA